MSSAPQAPDLQRARARARADLQLLSQVQLSRRGTNLPLAGGGDRSGRTGMGCRFVGVRGHARAHPPDRLAASAGLRDGIDPTGHQEPVECRASSYLARQAPEWLPRITPHRGRRTERHFWQPGGGCDRNIIEPRTLSARIDYIYLNPVRRGLVDRARD